ncbi:MAG: DUF929 family protein [Mycobacteriales bacterium]
MSNSASRKAAVRQRAAALQAARLRAERRRRLMIAGGAIAAVVVVVLGLVVAKVAGVGSGNGKPSATSTPAAVSAAVIRDVTSVPAATLDKIGAGTATAAPRRINAPALTADGKPRVLYVGAEFCPFCAAQRWALVVAMSRFGTWSNLGSTSSASGDVYPDTQTLSFHGAGFAGTSLSFTGVETRGNTLVGGQYEPLDTLSADDQKLFETYDKAPYTTGTPNGIPFLDIGGRYVLSGASYSPGVLAGKSRAQIAAALSDPSNPMTKAIGGAANMITAAICAITGNQPGSVCSSAGVTAAASKLTKA